MKRIIIMQKGCCESNARIGTKCWCWHDQSENISHVWGRENLGVQS